MKLDNTEYSFALSTICTEVAVRVVLAQIRAELSAQGITDEVCGNVEIALAEAMNNISEHAYAKCDPGAIDITGRIADGQVHFTLRDQGEPLPGLSLPAGVLPDNEVAVGDLPEGGFGCFLIRSLAERLNYSWESEENRLTLVFSL